MLHPLPSEGTHRQFSFQNTNEVLTFSSLPFATFLQPLLRLLWPVGVGSTRLGVFVYRKGRMNSA